MSNRDLIEQAKKELGFKRSGKFSLKGISSSSVKKEKKEVKKPNEPLPFSQLLKGTQVQSNPIDSSSPKLNDQISNMKDSDKDVLRNLIANAKLELGISPVKKKFSLKGISSHDVRGDKKSSEPTKSDLQRKKLIELAKQELKIPGGRNFSLKGISSSSKSTSTQTKEEKIIGPKKPDESKKENDSDSDDYSAMRKRYRSYYDSSDDEEDWVDPKTLSAKRKLYECGKDFVTMKDILPWPEYSKKNRVKKPKKINVKFSVNDTINSKISMWKGDITTMEIDAIVNAANRSLMGGGGVDGSIHSAAGSWYIRKEVKKKHPNGCSTGDCKLTKGYKLPAKYILHTVGPMNEEEDQLQKCYESTLDLVLKSNIKTFAFCCVATGIYGFPLKKATHIALKTCRKWLEINHAKVDRVIFCVYLDIEKEVYERFIPWYFPQKSEVIKDMEEQDEMEPQTPKYGGSFFTNFSWSSYYNNNDSDDDGNDDNDNDEDVNSDTMVKNEVVDGDEKKGRGFCIPDIDNVDELNEDDEIFMKDPLDVDSPRVINKDEKKKE